MGLLARGMAFLSNAQATNEGETVSYSVQGATAKAIIAVIGGPGFGLEENADVPGRIGDWQVDFVIQVSDWVTAGLSGEPQQGDKITRTITRSGVSSTCVFRVYVAGNQPAWDWGEPERLTFRIHARFESSS